MKQYDLILVGCGQGASGIAKRWSEAGHRVALVERRPHLGGSCVNVGCTPSKLLLASAHAAGRARVCSALGIRTTVDVDFQKVMERVRQVRSKWREGLQFLYEQTDVLHAEGVFVGPRRLRVGDEILTAERIVIDTGSLPSIPPIDGLEEIIARQEQASDPPARHLVHTNETLFELETLPPRLTVLGAGFIGLEMGQAFARLGAEVTIVDEAPRPLDGQSEALSDCLRQALEADGIRFRLNTRTERATTFDGAVTLHLTRKGAQAQTEALVGDALLVAAGRRPASASLDPAAGGLELDDRDQIVIDEQYRTSVEGVWAIGEVAGRPPFTHAIVEDGRRLTAIWNGESRHANDRAASWAAFTQPEVGQAGQTAEQARQLGTTEGFEVCTARLPLAETTRGTLLGETDGFFELVARADTGRLLGATFVGPQAAEMVQAMLLAIDRGLTLAEIEASEYIHPTWTEALRGTMQDLARTLKTS